jgi:cytidylate kinase
MAIITISRGIASGGREFAQRLAKKLGYNCLSREVISACSRKYNIMENDLYARLVEAPGWWKRPSKEHRQCIAYIQCSLIDAAKQDNVIYHGYAGQLFLRGVKHVLKIRLETPMAYRVEAAMKEFGKSHEQAVQFIENADAERVRWMKSLYGEDWHDPLLYDLVLNLRSISLDTACDMVALMLTRSDFVTTEASAARLNELSLECEVKAALVSDNDLWNLPIGVKASGSEVTLSGTVGTKRIREKIAEVAGSVKGVSECISNIRLSKEFLDAKTDGWGHE